MISGLMKSRTQTEKPGGVGVFSRTVIMWMVLVGVLSFSAFIVLLTYADDLRDGNDAGAHALSRSAVGYARLVDIMNVAEPGSAIVSRGSDERWERGLNILTPRRSADLDEEALDAFSEPVLIILPKWVSFPDPTHPGWAKRMDVFDNGAFSISPYGDDVEVTVETDDVPQTLVLTASDDPASYSSLGYLSRQMADEGLHKLALEKPIEHLQTMSGEGLAPILTDEKGRMILAILVDTDIFVLSEPDLANTWGLVDAQRTQVINKIVNVLRHGDGAVYFDVTLHGLGRSRNLMKLAFEPPFAAASLAAILAAAMMAWRAAVRFGPTIRQTRAIALGKQALAENTAALIRLARREHRYGSGYADLIRRATARAAGAPPGLQGAELDAFLNRIARVGASDTAPPPIEVLAEEAAQAENRAGLMRAARRLFQWKQEFDRERL